MTPEALEAFKAHARAEYPREACGLLVNSRYVSCRNLAETPAEHFVLSPHDYLAASQQGKVEAVCHTHPNASAEPSEADRAACEASQLPWYILSWPTEVLRSIAPCGHVTPLLGRAFVHGIHDCYGLVRDYYKQTLGIEIPDYERRDQWWERGENLYMEFFAEAGFVSVPDLQPHDVILMQVRSPVANHAAVYLGNNIMIHHLWGRLSKRDVYGGYWAKHTRLIVRHRSRP